jgi:DNA-binding MarR family transcriptional regulator
MAKPSTAAGADAQFVDGYLPALLAQAHHLVSGEFHAVASEHGFTPSDWRVLATLASGEPSSIGRLAQIAVMKQPTVTRLLDRMEASGHVRRLPSGGDRRVTLVAITPAGKKVAARLIPLAREHERRVLEPFGAQRAAELKETLMHLIASHKRQE